MKSLTQEQVQQVADLVPGISDFGLLGINYYNDLNIMDIVTEYGIPGGCGYDNLRPEAEQVARGLLGK